MTQELNLHDDIPAVLSGFGEIKLVTFELNGGLFGHDFPTEETFFSLLERQLGIEDFAEDRLQAQASLLAQRIDYPWNFDIEAIYAGLRASSQSEITLLRNIWTPRRHARAVIDYATRYRIPMAAACEGPFPEKFWREILAQHKIEGVERIYTTCDLAVSKQKYSMFRRIIADYDIEPQQILHFGPNSYNDLGVPLDIGMRAFLLGSESKAIAAKSPIFDKVGTAVGDLKTLDAHLLLKTMERAILTMPATSTSEKDDEIYILGICVAGPLIIGFCNWILNWLSYHRINHLILACAESSVFARIASIWLRRRMPGLEITVAAPERAAELGLQIRDIDVSDAAVVSVDSEGSGVGRLIARNPHLALRPALHYALSGSNRNSARDYCFVHANGIPPARFQIAKSTITISRAIFDGDERISQVLIAAASRFIIEWAKTEALYGAVALPRSMVMKVLEAVGETDVLQS